MSRRVKTAVRGGKPDPALLRVRRNVIEVMGDDTLTRAEIRARIFARKGIGYNRPTLDRAMNVDVLAAGDKGFGRTFKKVWIEVGRDSDDNPILMERTQPAYFVVSKTNPQRGNESFGRLARPHLSMWRKRVAEVHVAIEAGLSSGSDKIGLKAGEGVVAALEGVISVEHAERAAMEAEAGRREAEAEAAALRKRLAEIEAAESRDGAE